MQSNGTSEAGEMSEEELERQHFQKVVDAFMFYKTSALRKLEKRVKDFKRIPEKHKQLLPDFLTDIDKHRKAIDDNYKVLTSIVDHTDHMFTNADHAPGQAGRDVVNPLTGEDMSKVRTTLTQLVRDWAEEGKEERNSTYKLILDELEQLYPKHIADRSKVSVLVPGAGLGRLMFEIAKAGFSCQGNEFSLYMLFASNFILNRCNESDCITIYPWVHQFCNVLSDGDPIRPVKIPDVNPHDLPQGSNFSMAAGDFLEVYTERNEWSCVATCFFIDTAHNVIAYIEKIYDILKPGGYWINLGPLLYHFADIPGEISLELSYEKLKKIIIEDFKFVLLKEDLGIKSGYIQNPNSLLKMTYESIFFVVQKPDKSMLKNYQGHTMLL